MRRPSLLGLALALAVASAASGQQISNGLSNGGSGGVSVTGTPTTGNCAKFASATSIQDAGSTCGGGSGSPVGANTQIQYDNAGAFGGIANAVYDGAGSIHFTAAQGTQPFTVDSTTQVGNLNATKLAGGNWLSPGTIGSTTPNTGAFTTLTATTFNKWTLTAPATGITLTGTDNSTYTMPSASAAIQAAIGPAPISGRWFFPPFQTMGNGTALNATGTVQFVPFLIPYTVTVTEVTGRVVTAASGGNVQFAIYANNAATGRPTGSPLISTGSASTTTATSVPIPASFSATPTLTPGLYWFGVNADATAGGVAVMTTLVNTATIGASFIGSATVSNLVTATGAVTLSLTTPLTFGTWGDLTSATFTEVNTLKSAVPILLVN